MAEVCLWCRGSLDEGGATIRYPCECARASHRRIHSQCHQEQLCGLLEERGRRDECWPTAVIRLDLECPVCRRVSPIQLQPARFSVWRTTQRSLKTTIDAILDRSSLQRLGRAAFLLVFTLASVWSELYFLPVQKHEKDSSLDVLAILLAPVLQVSVFFAVIRFRACHHDPRILMMACFAWMAARAMFLRALLPVWWIREPLALLACVVLASLANWRHVIPDWTGSYALKDEEKQQEDDKEQ